MTNEQDELVSLLQRNLNDKSIAGRIASLEEAQPADLNRDVPLLDGVWGLRRSSSSQPWLRQEPWLENL